MYDSSSVSNSDFQSEKATMNDPYDLEHEILLYCELNSQLKQESVNLSKFSISDLVDRERKISEIISSYNRFLARICKNPKLDLDFGSKLMSLQSSFNDQRKILKDYIKNAPLNENVQQSNLNLSMLERFQTTSVKNCEKNVLPEEFEEVTADDVDGYQPSIIAGDDGLPEKLNIHEFWSEYLEVFLKNSFCKDLKSLVLKFRYTKLDQFLELSMAEQENVIEKIIEISIANHSSQASKMLSFCQEVAQMFGLKSVSDQLIKNCLKKYYETPIYHDLKNYQQRLTEIEECQDDKQKIIIQTRLDTEKLALKNRYLACLKMISIMLSRKNVNIDFVAQVINHLLNQSVKSIEYDDYFECFLKFFNYVGARYKSESNRLGKKCTEKYEDIYFKIRRIQTYSNSKFSADNLEKLAELINSMEKEWPEASICRKF